MHKIRGYFSGCKRYSVPLSLHFSKGAAKARLHIRAYERDVCLNESEVADLGEEVTDLRETE
jgi:hypothetical protein